MIRYFENNMKDMFRTYIHLPDRHWIDVSMKQVIIYGAGQGCLDFMNEMLLPNIFCVIDSDEKKRGREIELMNVRYKIQSPSLLSSLELENYYILISSSENEQSIKKSIEKYIPLNSVLLCNRNQLFFCYKKIEDMLYYDPLMKRKILLTNMSFAIEHVISVFNNNIRLLKNITIDRFMPLREGESKLAFLFGNNEELWVFSIPGYHNSWEKIGIERDKERNKRIRYELRKRIDIDKAITVYEDENGVLVQKYADEYIDFDKDEIKRIVLDKCRRLHQTNESLDIQSDLREHHYINLTEKVLNRAAFSRDLILKIDSKMKKVVEMLGEIDYKPQICHGDLFCENVVCYRGDLFFIDWEYMAMGDAMFDVCRLLFSMGLKRGGNGRDTYKNILQNIYEMLRDDMNIYFERECTDKEYLHAFLVMLVFECRELYEEILLKRVVDIEKVDLLINRIECIGKL